MKQIKVVIADDNERMREIIREGIAADEEIQVVGLARDGMDACEIVREKKPDVLLLDLIMPGLDGISVLERLFPAADFSGGPCVIVISAVSAEGIIREAFEKGAQYYFIKPFDPQMLVGRIKEAVRKGNRGNLSGTIPPYENSNTILRRNMEHAVTKLLHELGIPAHLKGYQYLRDAVTLAVCRKSGFYSITKDIYPFVAKKNHAAVGQVERAMRHAIETGWCRGNIDVIHDLFGYTVRNDRGKPTNLEFVALLADRLRAEFS